MKFITTELPGVVVIEPDVHRDDRGYFLETYEARKYKEGGVAARFVQDNSSRSVRGTLRGLHAQLKYPQAKLVRVIQGEIYDVSLDIRRGSPTFGKWTAATLSAENFKQVFVPEGFAHGFCVMSEIAEVEYKCSEFYKPSDEVTVLWNDPAVGIQWPIKEPLLSKKDQAGLTLSELLNKLPSISDGCSGATQKLPSR